MPTIKGEDLENLILSLSYRFLAGTDTKELQYSYGYASFPIETYKQKGGLWVEIPPTQQQRVTSTQSSYVSYTCTGMYTAIIPSYWFKSTDHLI